MGPKILREILVNFLVAISGVALVHMAITSPNGDVSGGWTLNVEHVRIGFIRTMYPFFAGLLMARVAQPVKIKNALLWCALLLTIILYMPRIGGDEKLWMNALYESVCIILLFPLIVYLGAGAGKLNKTENKLCRFLGDIYYSLYMVHYPLVYFYVAWISNNNGVTINKAWPYAIVILFGSLILAYASLKWYDEPLRKWLRKKMAHKNQ